MLVFETLLILVAVCVCLAVVARRLNTPLAVALVLGGIALTATPFVPPLEIEPDLMLALFLPPLLQVSAQRTDWRAFSTNLLPILLLAIGAVVFTALAVAGALHFLVPGLPWWGAITLGAIVAPPDAVAATSVLRSFRLPRRIVTVLEGESLINDASSLVLYRLAVGATLAGSIGWSSGLGFLAGAVTGSAIGLAVAWIISKALTRLDEPMLEITVSMLAGFGSYLLAEQIHGSGVLAAVMCGGLLGRHQLLLSARTRLASNTTWQFIEFILTSLLFILIGLQLRGIVESLDGYSLGRLVILGAAVAGAVIVSRIIWVFGTFYPVEGLRQVYLTGKFDPPLSFPGVISWAGMRGVVSLALALALPASFPSRDLFVFLAFSAIFATLVLQGTTLGWLIRKVSIVDGDIDAVSPATILARREAAAAALQVLGEQADRGGLADTLVREFEDRLYHVEQLGSHAEAEGERVTAELQLRLRAITAARNKLAERRDELDGETFATLLEQIDLEEEQVRLALSGTRHEAQP